MSLSTTFSLLIAGFNVTLDGFFAAASVGGMEGAADFVFRGIEACGGSWNPSKTVLHAVLLTGLQLTICSRASQMVKFEGEGGACGDVVVIRSRSRTSEATTMSRTLGSRRNLEEMPLWLTNESETSASISTRWTRLPQPPLQ